MGIYKRKEKKKELASCLRVENVAEEKFVVCVENPTCAIGIGSEVSGN